MLPNNTYDIVRFKKDEFFDFRQTWIIRQKWINVIFAPEKMNWNLRARHLLDVLGSNLTSPVARGRDRFVMIDTLCDMSSNFEYLMVGRKTNNHNKTNKPSNRFIF